MDKYTRDEVFKNAIEYFNGDELATNVWINKYALKDSEGNLYELTPDDMHHRIARELYRIEQKYDNTTSYDDIHNSIKNFKYIVPQGSPMAGIGNDFQISSLSNCFVVGPQKGKNGTYEDSYGSVLRTDQEIIQLCKRRAGVGTTLEHIRPSGSHVKNAALTSTGVVPFMERYSNSIREVAQAGRRGALMLSTHVKSIDSEKFIDAKIDTTKVTGANVSVKIDDDFMIALNNGVEYTQQFPLNSNEPTLTNTINPLKVWNKLVENNWKSAEPGILFWDTIKRESVPDCYSDLGFESIGTNPCGEIVLCDADSCRLLLLNLFSYVVNPFTKDAYFDFELFKKNVYLAQRYMDDIVDLEIEQIDKILAKIESDPETDETKAFEKNLWQRIKQKCQLGRRTGTGVTGEGDMLAALGLKYGTKEATKFATDVHRCLAINAYKASTILAKERGKFPIFDMGREVGNPFIERLYNDDPELKELTEKYGRRNIALLTISPAGSVSIMTRTTSGIEPLFLPFYKRRRKINPNDKDVKVDFVDDLGDSWEEYMVYHHNFLNWAKINGYDVDSKTDEKYLKEIFEKSPYYGACSNDVNWIESVEMQGNIQKYVDHSISKTINLPSDTTVEMVDQLYRKAWEVGCKGVTIYRDGSRSGVLVSTEDKKKKEKEEVTKKVEQILKESTAPKRPKDIECDIIRFSNKGEKWIGFVGLMNGRPYEVFTGIQESFPVSTTVEKGIIRKVKDDEGNKRYDFVYKDKDGYEIIITGLSRAFKKEYWDMGKMISAILRHGMPIPSVINLLDSLHFDGDVVGTWKFGIKRMLKKYIIEEEGTKTMSKCPECGQNTLVNEGGCIQCVNPECGYSKCG